ncbi:radical SAM/SPASM domain-containing protein [Sinanaerobacter chloroacetimidivorans]|uniref:Radical SAM protein n=1 Tax=Sinanaerobacter chloroacetimidivorans TaxID=2818044 RepID=A0A8J7W4Q9_9FIRM|nr:radical SAM protein [Sinanaerobacter chloroacetimidivorans]MBR0599073.1 radical SAM protein [Sinanaerobacter chloroacetimidivorans]
MKPSRYNIVYPYQFNKDYTVVYNTFKDSVGILTTREAEFIKTCDRSLGIHYTKIDDFKKKGFIVDENTNELAIVKVDYLKSKFDKRLLSVVIVPTYQCNLDCTYCYEKLSYSTEDHTIMSKHVQDTIYEGIKSRLHGVEKLAVFWHGGEPLLALDVVLELGGRLQGLAKEKGIAFSSGMSTNGYLFTEDTAKKLYQIGITHYKMSIDGCRENHNIKKRQKDGGPTYDIILNNIVKSADYFDEIDLRLNVDKEDISDAYEMMSLIEEKGLENKVIPRLGKPQYFAAEENDLNFTKEEYMYEAIHYSLHQGVGPKKFSRKDCFCLIHQLYGIIVDGHGNLFKCISDTGDGQICGSLKNDGTVELNKNFYEHGIYNPTSIPACEECKFLPICYGECGFDRNSENPCTYQEVGDENWSSLINAYVVKRMLNRLKVRGMLGKEEETISIDDLIMGKLEGRMNEFISKASDIYRLDNLIALGRKYGVALSEEDAALLMQLMQPTELIL